jgi:hypothetical protein
VLATAYGKYRTDLFGHDVKHSQIAKKVTVMLSGMPTTAAPAAAPRPDRRRRARRLDDHDS